MIGARGADKGLRYPVSEVAGRFGASVVAETTDPAVAYADCEWGQPAAADWPLDGLYGAGAERAPLNNRFAVSFL